MRKYLVIFEKTETGYSAFVPDLPGCIATGDTKEKIEETIYSAIQFHLEGMKEDNIEIPKGNAESEVFVFT